MTSKWPQFLFFKFLMWTTFFKVFNLLQYCFCFGHKACKISALKNLNPLHWNAVLTAEPPGTVLATVSYFLPA